MGNSRRVRGYATALEERFSDSDRRTLTTLELVSDGVGGGVKASEASRNSTAHTIIEFVRRSGLLHDERCLKKIAAQRRLMVAAVRRSGSFRAVAARFRVSLCTVHRWFHRAEGKRLDRVDWTNRACGLARALNRTSARLERRIVVLRGWLQRQSALGESGAAAIRRQLKTEGWASPPCARTIERILHRHGLLTDRRRQRQMPPPPGWYLPELAHGRAELDSLDFIEGLVIAGGPTVDVFNAISLYGSLAQSWPAKAWSTAGVLAVLPPHWQKCGLPCYVQFDNDTRFQGPHTAAGKLGRVVHLCLCLGVIPVFAPPRETGFQAKIESFNHLWQAKVWRRHHFLCATQVRRQSSRFITAHRLRHFERIEAAPLRLPGPLVTPRDFTSGRIIFLRRTDGLGAVTLLQQTVRAARHWPHRLVRCELNPLTGRLQIYALRRRQPDWQPLLAVRHLVVKIAPWHHT